MDNLELRKVQKRLQERLTRMENVTGVGVGSFHDAGDGSERLTILLIEESEPTRDKVRSFVEAEAPGTPVGFWVSGQITAAAQ